MLFFVILYCFVQYILPLLDLFAQVAKIFFFAQLGDSWEFRENMVGLTPSILVVLVNFSLV